MAHWSRPWARAIAGAALAVGAVAAASAQEFTAERAEARAIVAAFQSTLAGHLKAAMADGGPTAAIPVCNRIAPAVATDFSSDGAWRVGRTALRVRNPDNAPNESEAAILMDFVARRDAGEDPAAMESIRVEVDDGGRRTLHYMKAIPMGEVCLACHGPAVEPDVLVAIRALYPEDQATGFVPGEIRGAFTLYKPLD